ncbi:MAG TPA: hypothetical protein VGM10_04620 [Actinocrinis sp.]
MTGEAESPASGGEREISVRTELGSRTVEILAGIAVQLPLTFTTAMERLGIEVEGLVDLVGDRLGCVQLEVKGAGEKTITGELLRQIPVGTLVASAVRTGLVQTRLVDDGRLRVTEPAWLTPPEGFPKAGPTDEALQFIALVYQLAYILGESPTKAVAQLGMPYATASRWIARARDAEYLLPTGPGRAGGVKVDKGTWLHDESPIVSDK